MLDKLRKFQLVDGLLILGIILLTIGIGINFKNNFWEKAEIKVTSKNINVIPFGVNIDEFSKKDVKSLFSKESFVIGCIKALEDLYNIDVLIKAFLYFGEPSISATFS